MSALPPKAEIRQRGWHVRFVPIADIRGQALPFDLLYVMMLRLSFRTIAPQHGIVLHLLDRQYLCSSQVIFEMGVPQFGLCCADLRCRGLQTFGSDRVIGELLI